MNAPHNRLWKDDPVDNVSGGQLLVTLQDRWDRLEGENRRLKAELSQSKQKMQRLEQENAFLDRCLKHVSLPVWTAETHSSED